MENVEQDAIYKMMIQVVKCAIDDYKKALSTKRRLWHMPEGNLELSKAIGTIVEVEAFFRGTLFGSTFPAVDPEYMIKRIRSYE